MNVDGILTRLFAAMCDVSHGGLLDKYSEAILSHHISCGIGGRC